MIGIGSIGVRGCFITFEGGEGSGKSTHAAMLAQRVKSQGIDVVLTREPGGSTGAEIIRHILLSGIAKPLGAETEAILFAAARDDHVRNTILPALRAGKWVICDRFIDSTRVYQGVLGNVDKRLIRSLERVTVGPALPDLTFILDVPAQIGLARAKSRRGQGQADRFEAESLEFHEKLRQAYRALALEEPQRCIVVDGRAPRDVVAERIWTIVQQRMRPERIGATETTGP
ncbi:MAG TPA: dTMP kinase [Pseudolabrys sp.]|nr:dTMP kinase [Pseudolabrys sp.]